MNVERFEQLVSAWLDEPHRADAKHRIAAAIAATPALADERERWIRLDRLVRASFPPVPAIDQERLAARIAAAIDAELEDVTASDRLAAALAALPSVVRAVRWNRFRERVAAAIQRADRSRRSFRIRPRSARAFVGLAAAALAALLLWPRTSPSRNPPGIATARIVAVSAARSASPRADSFVRVQVLASAQPVEIAAGTDHPPAEFFLMIDPPLRSAPPRIH